LVEASFICPFAWLRRAYSGFAWAGKELEGAGFVGPERTVVKRHLFFDSVEEKAGINALMRVSEPWEGEERVASMQRS
jgi:hypothetical protein